MKFVSGAFAQKNQVSSDAGTCQQACRQKGGMIEIGTYRATCAVRGSSQDEVFCGMPGERHGDLVEIVATKVNGAFLPEEDGGAATRGLAARISPMKLLNRNRVGQGAQNTVRSDHMTGLVNCVPLKFHGARLLDGA